MSYVFSREKRTVWWPATVHVPKDGGVTEDVDIEICIELPRSADLDGAQNLSHKEARKRLADYVRDWRGVVDESASAVAFSKKALLDLMEYRFFANAIAMAFAQASVGARAKN